MKRRILSIALALCLCISILPAAYAADVPTAAEVYNTLISYQTKSGYTEGTPWTNDKEYSLNVPLNGATAKGYGCAAFAYELSDAAFGTLPARMVSPVSLSDVRVGDILRVNGDTHSVIVLSVSDVGVTVAEGNYSGTVHWGRSIEKDDVQAADYLITRYPADYNPDPGTDADAPIEPGAEGKISTLTWKVTSRHALTITGTGAMQDFSFSNDGSIDQPWNAYAAQIQNIVIGSGVTSIGSNAFRALPSLLAVTIPESVTSIGENAFRSCTALTSITLPASISSVGAGAFTSCEKLESAAFTPGSSVVTIGDSLFTACWNLKSVILPSQADSISEGMFLNCMSLTSVTIPEGVTTIGNSAFSSCTQLTYVWIPSSVTQIGTAAFSACSALTEINFGGTESQWNAITNMGNSTAGKTINYNAVKPSTPVIPPSTSDHTHNWSPAWSGDETHHWHECIAATACTITANSGKDGYAAHAFGDWTVDQEATETEAGSKHRECSVCGYVQTETIPATGNSTAPPTTPTNPTTPTTPWTQPTTTTPSTTTPSSTTTQNPDGSTTTTHIDKATGTVTETTQNRDGSQTVVETRTDGTVTTTQTDQTGNVTETVAKPDGSSTVTVERTDGVTAFIQTAAGKVEASVSLPSSVVSTAQQTGEAVNLPIPEIQAVKSTAAAAAITVNTGSQEPVKVEIPTAATTPGTVAVIVHSDGTEEVIKTTVPTENGVAVFLPDGATVKIVDNSKNFTDISSQNWAADAIDFVSARELFSGTTETAFTPEAPMTRAMLIVVLARLDGADTTSGTSWYEQGVEWAAANGISDGSSLDESVTREQLVTMLWRYAGSPSVSGALSGFTDTDQISGYAQEAMCWAIENGIVSGFDNGQLEPQGQATRAQVAQMLMNFIEK